SRRPGLVPGDERGTVMPEGPPMPANVSVGASLGLPVPPRSGWPEDPATPATPIAADATQVRALAAEAVQADKLDELTARQSVCRACPRLVEWREQVAAVKRASSRNQRYWERPIPGWGDDNPRLLILELAPAAHGGNRTKQIF